MKIFNQTVDSKKEAIHIYESSRNTLRKMFNDIEITDQGMIQKFAHNKRATVDFNTYASEGFAWTDENTGDKGVCIQPQDPDKMLMVLLHEIGHHIESQIDNPSSGEGQVFNERMAWEGAFKLARKLNIEVSHGMKDYASKCFYSYTNALGKSKQTQQWMNKVGFRDHGFENDRAKVVREVSSEHPLPTFHKVEFENPLKNEPCEGAVVKSVPFWCKESWKTKGKFFK